MGQWEETGLSLGSDPSTVAGRYRFSITRKSAVSVLKNTVSAFQWSGEPDYAIGIELSQTRHAVRVQSPGVYLLAAAMQLDGNPTDGNRFEAWLARYQDDSARYASGSTYLPGRYPVISLSVPAVVSEPDTEIALWYYQNSSAKLYTGNNANYFSVVYLGPLGT